MESEHLILRSSHVSPVVDGLPKSPKFLNSFHERHAAPSTQILPGGQPATAITNVSEAILTQHPHHGLASLLAQKTVKSPGVLDPSARLIIAYYLKLLSFMVCYTATANPSHPQIAPISLFFFFKLHPFLTQTCPARSAWF